ncbi:MAG: hypothetical protein SFX18_17805 [Pirellulales bacterium]|nr:hypothetical protein [Pirellulales bacterium]
MMQLSSTLPTPLDQQVPVSQTNWTTPRADGAQLVDPEIAAWLHLAAANRAEFDYLDYDAQGRSLRELSAQARYEVLQAALAATRQYRDYSSPLAAFPSDRMAEITTYVAGHQPELFHPGVWLKNGCLSRAAQIETARHSRATLQRLHLKARLADMAEQAPFPQTERHGEQAITASLPPHLLPLIDAQQADPPAAPCAVALNMVVDTDLLKSAAIRVPAASGWPHSSTANGQQSARDQINSSVQIPHSLPVTLDGGPAQVPWELRLVADHELLASWPQRMLTVAWPGASAGCWREYWPLVVERARATGNLGLALSQARHQYEANFGWQTLELPLSQMQQLPAVRWLLLHLLANLPRLSEVYNAAITEYRQRHGLRSTAHPAPLLENQGEWLEAPFWVWSAAAPRRRRVFARWKNDQLQLTDQGDFFASLPCTPGLPLDEAIAAWNALEERGYCLRTKALLTTLLSRTLLADLFVHGIGGAKYDQVTDRIISEFFGWPAPRFAVVTGTLRWPQTDLHYQRGEELRLRAGLRALTYQPERFLCEASEPAVLSTIQAKAAAVALPKIPRQGKPRQQAIARANAALQPAVEPLRAQWQAQLVQLEQQKRMDQIFASRELAFPLHPSERLRGFWTG